MGRIAHPSAAAPAGRRGAERVRDFGCGTLPDLCPLRAKLFRVLRRKPARYAALSYSKNVSDFIACGLFSRSRSAWYQNSCSRPQERLHLVPQLVCRASGFGLPL